MKRSVFCFVVFASFILFWQFYIHYEAKHKTPVMMPLPLPASALRVISMGHDQAMGQTLFFKAMFYNEFLAQQDSLPADLPTTLHLLDTATQLDPYNMDCYYYGQALFSEHSDFVKPFNELLMRGTNARKWDFYPPWFLGVNYYFTLSDKKNAGEYFFMCAKRNTEDAFFANLAARAFQEGKETETAVLILREMLAQSLSPVVEEKIKIRLIAFETVLFLETALQKYRTIHGVSATSLSDLIDSALLTEIPPDPYGGKFYLDLDGSVKTTSRFAFPKESEKKK